MAKPAPLDRFLSGIGLQRRRARPTETLGAPGTAIYGGFIEEREKSPDLASRDARYRTYGDILANVSIVAAGVRYFLNLVAGAAWSFTPSEADTDGRFAELAEEMLTRDPTTPWHCIVRRAATYRPYGFALLEWTAKRREDGLLTFADIAPRAQLTIERWDVDETGKVLGVLQRSPQSQRQIYLPREKLVYIVDDTLNDSPEGLGLFRHLVAPAKRLQRYEQLEGIGFETDLRGIPKVRIPFEALHQQVKNGQITEAERNQIEASFRKFAEDHIKTAKTGLLLDSMTYQTQDQAGRPSNVPLWDVELMQGDAQSFAENAAAIERLNRQLARILGVEQLMLGSDGAGSFALSQNKTQAFFLMVDGALTEIREAVEGDLLGTLWWLNGWPDEMMPELSVEHVHFTDLEQVGRVLRDVATAGLPDDDPIHGWLRGEMGAPLTPGTGAAREEDAALVGNQPEGQGDDAGDGGRMT